MKFLRNRQDETYIGLFANFGTGEVRNLTLDNAIFTGNRRTGGIVGLQKNGTVRNCHVTASCSITCNGTWSGGVIGANGKTLTIGAFRAYFSLNDGLWAGEPTPGRTGIKAFVLNFGGGETGIANMNTTNPTDPTWHLIDGRKLPGKPTRKGIYINNGRKVVIK